MPERNRMALGCLGAIAIVIVLSLCWIGFLLVVKDWIRAEARDVVREELGKQ